jgi:hypothetical protein
VQLQFPRTAVSRQFEGDPLHDAFTDLGFGA